MKNLVKIFISKTNLKMQPLQNIKTYSKVFNPMYSTLASWQLQQNIPLESDSDLMEENLDSLSNKRALC